MAEARPNLDSLVRLLARLAVEDYRREAAANSTNEKAAQALPEACAAKKEILPCRIISTRQTQAQPPP
jgi:hypothetical protein